MKHSDKETEIEKRVRAFAVRVFDAMGWGEMKITRFKVGNTQQWRGHCYGRYLKGELYDIYVSISNNAILHPTEKRFWDSVVHELCHAKLALDGASIPKAFGHGKAFKNVVKSVAATSKEYTYKQIMK